MSAPSRIKKGFTLVEILIVVVILGILAAIVIPQFTSASESAKGSSVVAQLQTIRSQLELYQVQHNGDYPDLVTDGWINMTDTTDATGDTAGSDFGPYLQKAPVNPFTGLSAVGALGSATEGTDGWAYDSTTGEILLVVNTTDVDLAAVGIDASDVEAVGGTSTGGSTGTP